MIVGGNMRPKMISTVLTHGISIDSMTIGQAVEVLQQYDSNAHIDFLTGYDGDTYFSITLSREQTLEEALEAERQMQELIDYQVAQEYKEYQRLKKKYDAEGELQ